MCRSILDGNPHVDEVWELPMATHAEMAAAWRSFYREALQRKQAGDFDEVYFTQIYPDNFRNFDGTVRASILRAYPRPITVPVTPVIRLTPSETENVRRFAQNHGLADPSRVILFEFLADSAQTFIGPDFARDAALGIVAQLPDCKVILTSHFKVRSDDPRIIDGSALSFRENAELTKYCSLLIGCSSGITWLCTSDWAKPLPTIQLLSRRTSVFASVVHDHEHFGLPTDAIIEMTDCPADDLVDCVVTSFQRGFADAKKQYHQTIPVRFDFYLAVLKPVIQQGRYRQVFASIMNVIRRYGLRSALIAALVRFMYSRARSFFVK